MTLKRSILSGVDSQQTQLLPVWPFHKRKKQPVVLFLPILFSEASAVAATTGDFGTDFVATESFFLALDLLTIETSSRFDMLRIDVFLVVVLGVVS